MENACIHVYLVLMVAYTVCIAAHRLGRRAPAEHRLLRVMMVVMMGWS